MPHSQDRRRSQKKYYDNQHYKYYIGNIFFIVSTLNFNMVG